MKSSKIFPLAKFSRNTSSRFWKSLRAAGSHPVCQLAGWTRRKMEATPPPPPGTSHSTFSAPPTGLQGVLGDTRHDFPLDPEEREATTKVSPERSNEKPGPELWKRTAGSRGRLLGVQRPAVNGPGHAADARETFPEQRSSWAVICSCQAQRRTGGNSVSTPSNRATVLVTVLSRKLQKLPESWRPRTTTLL